MHRHLRRPIRASNPSLFIFFCSLSLSAVLAKDASAAVSAKKVPVRVFQVTPSLFEDTLTTLGTIHAEKEIKLGFETSGTIKAIHFQEGLNVKAGTLLAELDPKEHQLALLHSQARVKVEETALERIGKKLENHEKLLEAGSILQSRLDEVALEVKEAELSLEAARIQVRYSEANFAKTRLLCPSDGTIAVKHAEAGETVTPNTLVATLVDLKDVVCEVDITEQEYYRVRIGAPCILNTDALVGYFFKGVVQSIPPVLTGKSRSIRIRIKVAQPENLLLPGMLVHVKILLYRKDKALVIPSESVRWVGGKPFVFVVDLNSQMASLKPIRIAYRGLEMTEVAEGLRPQDLIIVGQTFTEDKVHVEVVETQIPTLPGR